MLGICLGWLILYLRNKSFVYNAERFLKNEIKLLKGSYTTEL